MTIFHNYNLILRLILMTTVLSVSVCLNAQSSPISLELVEPGYRGAIFSSSPHKVISVKLIANDGHVGDLVVALVDSSGKWLQNNTGVSNGKQVSFSASMLKVGKYSVITVSKDDKANILASVSFAVLPSSENEVYLDKDGICRINGKPFFPIGIWHADGFIQQFLNTENRKLSRSELSDERMFRNVADAGFNSVMIFTEAQPYMDLASKYSLKAILVCRNPESEIPKLANHPALLGWATEDEPPAEAVQRLSTLYDRIKTNLDPYHPVQISQYNNSMFASMGAICDIVAVDDYPLRDIEPWWRSEPWWNPKWVSQLRFMTHYTTVAQNALPNGKTVWPVVGAFAQSAGYGGWELPTYDQVRNQTYQAIACGARGISFYAYVSNEPVGAPGSEVWWIERSPLWVPMRKLIAELHTLEPVILAPGGKRVSIPGAEDLVVLDRSCKGKRYLIVVNIGETEQVFKFSMNSPWTRAVNKFTGKRLKVDKGVLQEILSPFAVRVYEMSR